MEVKTLFVSSSDAYADIWPAFFTLFRRYWPDFNGTIYLNTEKREFSFPGLEIICTKVGTQKSFGRTFKLGLGKLPEETFLLMMIDYFIEDMVDVAVLNRLYDRFVRTPRLDSITLMH